MQLLRFNLLWIGILVFMSALAPGQALSQDTIFLVQCRGDRSLPSVAEYAQRDKGITVKWEELPLAEVRTRVMEGIERNEPVYDGIWGCPVALLQDLFESDVADEAFLPAADYVPFTYSDALFDPGSRWFPVTANVGVVCMLQNSGLAQDVQDALEKDPGVLLRQQFQGRVGFPDPVVTATGYNWLDSFARKVGYDQIEDFAAEFVEKTKPVVGARCERALSGEIDIAFTSWGDARNFVGKVDVLVSPQSWTEPDVFAVLASGEMHEAARALLETLTEQGLREEIIAKGEILVPLEGADLEIQIAEATVSTMLHLGPAGSAKRDTNEVAAAAVKASVNGCNSNLCKQCDDRRCRLCKHCI